MKALQSEMEMFADEYWEETENLSEQESDYHEIGQLSTIPEYREFLEQLDALVPDWTRAITLNRSYGSSLGWNQYYSQINDLLLPISGLQNVSLGEDAFAQAVAAWQANNGLTGKNADGIIGPNTWRLMQPFIFSSQPTSPAPITPPVNPALPTTPVITGSAQSEYASSAILQSKYANVSLYEIARNQVISWGINNPGQHIESAIQEWNSNPGIHAHFDRNFDGDPHHSYLNLKRLYNKKGIQNPAAYFTSNIVPITFFNRNSPGHRDLKIALANAQASLSVNGISYTLASAWSFVPRTFNTDINKLSNHALGKAIDINPATNPHILSSAEFLVINAVCRSILPNGLQAESNPDIIRRASQYFKQNYSDAWIAQQTQSSILSAIRTNGKNLKRYALNGFFDLPTPLVQHLQNAGLSWGGTWKSAKDFMHFELI